MVGGSNRADPHRNGAAGAVHADAHSDAATDLHPHSDRHRRSGRCDCDADQPAGADRYQNPKADRLADQYRHSQSGRDSDVHGHTDSNRERNSDRDSRRNGHPDGFPDGYAQSYPDGYAHPHTQRDGHGGG